MAEMRQVRLVTAATNQLGNGGSSTYHYENRKYVLVGRTPLAVNLEVANAWVSADSNVEILPER